MLKILWEIHKNHLSVIACCKNHPDLYDTVKCLETHFKNFAAFCIKQTFWLGFPNRKPPVSQTTEIDRKHVIQNESTFGTIALRGEEVVVIEGHYH